MRSQGCGSDRDSVRRMVELERVALAKWSVGLCVRWSQECCKCAFVGRKNIEVVSSGIYCWKERSNVRFNILVVREVS